MTAPYEPFENARFEFPVEALDDEDYEALVGALASFPGGANVEELKREYALKNSGIMLDDTVVRYGRQSVAELVQMIDPACVQRIGNREVFFPPSAGGGAGGEAGYVELGGAATAGLHFDAEPAKSAASGAAAAAGPASGQRVAAVAAVSSDELKAPAAPSVAPVAPFVPSPQPLSARGAASGYTAVAAAASGAPSGSALANATSGSAASVSVGYAVWAPPPGAGDTSSRHAAARARGGRELKEFHRDNILRVLASGEEIKLVRFPLQFSSTIGMNFKVVRDDLGMASATLRDILQEVCGPAVEVFGAGHEMAVRLASGYAAMNAAVPALASASSSSSSAGAAAAALATPPLSANAVSPREQILQMLRKRSQPVLLTQFGHVFLDTMRADFAAVRERVPLSEILDYLCGDAIELVQSGEDTLVLRRPGHRSGLPPGPPAAASLARSRRLPLTSRALTLRDEVLSLLLGRQDLTLRTLPAAYATAHGGANLWHVFPLKDLLHLVCGDSVEVVGQQHEMAVQLRRNDGGSFRLQPDEPLAWIVGERGSAAKYVAMEKFDQVGGVLAMDLQCVQSTERQTRISVLQLCPATPMPPQTVHVFDALANIAHVYNLRSVLENPRVTKVLFDCRPVARALSSLERPVHLAGVVDLTALSALLASANPQSGVADGNGGAQALLDLTGRLTGRKMSNVAQMIVAQRKDPEQWMKRPLPRVLLRCACELVAHLGALHEALLNELKKAGVSPEAVAAASETRLREALQGSRSPSPPLQQPQPQPQPQPPNAASTSASASPTASSTDASPPRTLSQQPSPQQPQPQPQGVYAFVDPNDFPAASSSVQQYAAAAPGVMSAPVLARGVSGAAPLAGAAVDAGAAPRLRVVAADQAPDAAKSFAELSDSMEPLLAALPPRVRATVQALGAARLAWIALDVGRRAEAVAVAAAAATTTAAAAAASVDGDLVGKAEAAVRPTPSRELVREGEPLTPEEVAGVVASASAALDASGAGFVGGTLHRVVAVRGPDGAVSSVTLRVARACAPVGDVARAVRDLLDRGRSVLILGAPGAGKTTALRSVARALARRRRVLVVDRTGGELAGRSEAPHRAVGDARRLLLEAGAPSHHAMVNALQQFLPEVLVVDNVSGADEARALRCVGEEGVAVIAAARAATLKAVLESPELCGLVGVGPRGPGEAGRLARVRSAVFDACVELSGDCECRVYPALDEAVRALVDEVDPGFELRATSVSGGQVQVFAREMVPRRKRET